MIGPSLEIIFILGLILINGLFAMSEIAVVTARKARLQQMAERGSRRAKMALDLALDPNKFLSTIETGITLMGTLAGAVGGATVAIYLADYLATVELLEPYSYEIAFGIVVGLITYFNIVLGELVPKRIALANPERVASLISYPMHFWALLTAPIVKILSVSTGLIATLLRVRSSSDVPHTEEEITVLLAEGRQHGIIAEEEQEMVERIFRLGDQTARSVMTPRTDIIFLDLDAPPEKNKEKLHEKSHSRYIVCRGGLDNTLGMVTGQELLGHLLRNDELDIEGAITGIQLIPEDTPALQLLKRFKYSTEQVVLVIDEYGGVSGLVTLDDILEAIVGDIVWTGDKEEPDIAIEDEDTWVVEGMLSISEFKDHFNIRELPDEDEDTYSTLGGFVVTQLERIPEEGDNFEWKNFYFEVEQMEGNRVGRVRIVRISADDVDAEDGATEAQN